MPISEVNEHVSDNKSSKVILAGLGLFTAAFTALAIATQKLVESINTEEDHDRSW